jgi:hypothetical protein
MSAVVDPSADGVWNAVETIVTRAGTELHEPRTDQEWADTRRAALTLTEAANLLMLKDRRVGAAYFPAEAPGALDSTAIAQRISTRRPVFDGFASALQQAGSQAIAAIDRKDPEGLTRAGGVIDGVCEGCHRVFWYPNQVIPPLPLSR